MKPEITSVATPCVQICTLNAQQECIGCGRSIQEITRWRDYSDAEREEIMLRLKKPENKHEANTNATGDDKHERVTCLRCGERFNCKVNSPTRCDCVEIRLTPDEMDYILLLADGECLCLRCLELLREEYRHLQPW